MFQCARIQTYSNRNVIDFYVGNCNIVTQLKTMLSINPKENIEKQFPRNFFGHTICDKITAVTINIFCGLSSELVREIIGVVNDNNFVNHVAFVIEPNSCHDNANIKSIICASLKCGVYNNENEANIAASINSRSPFFPSINASFSNYY